MVKVDFFQNGLLFVGMLAQRELDEFELFHKTSEGAWVQEDARLRKDINAILIKYPEHQHDEIVESHGWELHRNQLKFPNIHRESLLITVYNFLEAQLNQTCKIIEGSVENPVKLKHLHGKGIERALLYLTKVGGLNLSRMSPELTFLKNINLLRNHLVHNGGVLPESLNNPLNKFVSNNSALRGGPDRDVILSKDFIQEFIGNLKGFFAKFEDELKVFMERANA